MSKYTIYIIWLMLYFTAFEGFGIRSESWGGLGSSFIGWYGILQLVTLLLALIIPLKYNWKIELQKYNVIFNSYKYIAILLIIIIIQSYFETLLYRDVTLYNIITNFIKMRYIYYYYIFIVLIGYKNGIKIAINSLLFYSIISALIALVLISTGGNDLVTKVSNSSDIGREFRVIIPTSMLIIAGLYFFITKSLLENKLVYIFSGILCFIATVLQMHRTLLITTALVSVYAILLNSKMKILNLLIAFISLAILSVIFYLILGEVGVSSHDFSQNINLSLNEFLTLDGTFGLRVFLVTNGLSYVIKNYLILGTGLNWEDNFYFEDYFENNFVAGPTYDSGYFSIIIVFGIAGLLTYAYLFKTIFSSLNISIKSMNVETKITSRALKVILVYILISAITSDNFLTYNATFIFTLLVALATFQKLK